MKGLLNSTYLSWANCEGSDWDDFRHKYERHVIAGKWNWADEAAWIMVPDHWDLVKSAELLLEKWRQHDFLRSVVDERSAARAMEEVRRSAAAEPFSVLDPSVLTSLAAEHLERLAAGSVPESFGARCLHGLLAAVLVFARALAVLGGSSALAPEGEDGFVLWRAEMGYLVAGLLLHEGSTLVDLTAVPGWPGVEARLLEQMLHWRQGALSASGQGASGGEAEGLRHVILGSPRVLEEKPPKRFPPRERYHRATDPMGVTPWGQAATSYAEERQRRLQSFLRGGSLHTVGPSWIRRPSPKAVAVLSSIRARVVALVSQHPSLDVEAPSLLEALFPEALEVTYILHGEGVDRICSTAVGVRVLEQICSQRIPNPEPSQGAEPGRAQSIFDGRRLVSRDDPRLLPRPDLLTVSSWIEAIWVVRLFPGSAVLLFFGPPLLLNIAKDIQNERTGIVNDFWAGFDELSASLLDGTCVVAAESLFRSEQLYFQVGLEVPFLRPMSVWVNATYRPRMLRDRAPVLGRVLIHNRGRLRYEPYFIRILAQMVGPAFPYEIVAQAGRILPFEEIAEFHAVVILPWSPELCILRNLFKMRVPMFVPGRSLLRNLVHISNQRLLPSPYHLQHPGLNPTMMKAAHPYDPFLDTARPAADPIGVAARAYWAEYSEYLMLPLVRHFAGAADLVVALSLMEGLKTSSQMRTAYLQDMDEMRSFWAECLAQLFGTSAADGGH